MEQLAASSARHHANCGPTQTLDAFQDRGELFSLEDGHPNVYAPHKRPFRTIIPAFVTKDGQPWLSFGVMGGDAPRWYHTGSSEPTGETMTDGGTVSLESGIAPEVVRTLTQMGHRIQNMVGVYGGYQAIAYDAKNDVYIGASESRKDGHAAGY